MSNTFSNPILNYVEQRALPLNITELFGEFLNCDEGRFTIQEGVLIDFKQSAPDKFTSPFGAGIVRLSLALHNTYGGLIVFGVSDKKFDVVGLDKILDIESFNRFLVDCTETKIECIAREYLIDGCAKNVQVVLVPKRGMSRPAALRRDLEKYVAGSLFLRIMHEVRIAKTEDFSLLFSTRNNVPGRDIGLSASPTHRSLPPPPATLKDFVGRQNLMKRLWEWFIFEDQPRLYLHGSGGSGKSTMAYEFARTIASESEQLLFSNGQPIDYVIYLSAKETELNIFSGKQQSYELRDFTDCESQFRKILYHAGLVSYDEMSSLNENEIESKLSELLSEFTGLIVIDDIDTLSRNKLDTGEETLFLKLALARKRTRILYTLRYVPPSALRSAIEVPGLDFASELPDFVMTCCRQFDIPVPQPQDYPLLNQRTDGLPLLVETIVGLRRDCGTYANAFRLFDQKGGDEARRYLYQREYDRLDNRGRARQVLAALMLVDAPVTFSTLAAIVPIFSEEQIKDAISEASTIFLATTENENGETSYQLSPPSTKLVRLASENLDYFAAVQRAVEQFQQITPTVTGEEKLILNRMMFQIRSKAYDALIAETSNIPNQHPIRVHPEFLSLLGQAYCRASDPNFTRARECFQTVEKTGYLDIFMMRQWYYLEMHSGYSAKNAEKICNIVISDKKSSPRYKSEFYAKLGECYAAQAKPHRYTDRQRSIELLRKSLRAYLEAAWFGRDAPGIDRNRHLEWLEVVARVFFGTISENLEPFFEFLDGLPDTKHDVEYEAAKTIIDPIMVLSRNHRTEVRSKVRGLCSRSISNLQKTTAKIQNAEGFRYIVEILKELQNALEAP